MSHQQTTEILNEDIIGRTDFWRIIFNGTSQYECVIDQGKIKNFKVNAARKSKVDDNTARMQSIKQLGV